MSVANQDARAKLTAYEAAQVQEIAVWKSKGPNLLSELVKGMTMPGAKLVEKVLPDNLVQSRRSIKPTRHLNFSPARRPFCPRLVSAVSRNSGPSRWRTATAWPSA